MPTATLTTFKDVTDHLMDFLGADSGSTSDLRMCRRAALEALSDISNSHNWNYYQLVGRVNTSAAYETGTITYDHTGGTYERELTLASGTWPSWAANGTVLINSIPYDVADRKSDTIVTLSANSNPGADVAAGTTYSIYREAYPLPLNFAKLTSELFQLSSKRSLSYLKPGEWHNQKTWSGSTGIPWAYTIAGDPNYHGVQTIRFQHAPSSAEAYGFLYKRHPRRLMTEEYSTGTVTASGTTITGSSDVAFTTDHVGCVLRISTTSDPVTGLAGSNPFTEERVVVSRTDATTLVVDSAFSGTYSSRRYILSDPVDVEPQAMLNLFLRTAELKLATIRRPEDRGAVYAAWERDYQMAIAADKRRSVTEQVGQGVGIDFVRHLLIYGENAAE